MNIIFTSCMNAERVPNQPIWDEIQRRAPDVLMLLGDQIYMDWVDLGASNWRASYHGADVTGRKNILSQFAAEMHGRYKLQWEVRGFRELVASLNNNGKQIILTWDDHDFSWNNSLGVDEALGTSDLYKHGTPEQFKYISGRLFQQFKNQLKGTTQADAGYPNLPADVLEPFTAPAPPAHEYSTLGGKFECLALDGRWFKTPRTGHGKEPGTLLGDAQQLLLADLVKNAKDGNDPLLIVACGSPAVHDYLISSQQDWRGDETDAPAYPEYETLSNATRPVLFLGGDIHRNAWGGVLPTKDGTPSRVIQLLSSGAAIPPAKKIFWFELKKTEPRFCEVEISNKCVKPKFYRAEGDHLSPTFIEEFNMGQPLTYENNDWTNTRFSHGEAWDAVRYPVDKKPLLVLHARKRLTAEIEKNPDSDTSLEAQWDQTADENIQWPECFDLTKQDESWRLAHHQIGSTVRDDEHTRNETELAIQRVFDRANKKPVVLFIHGFGKSLVDAVHQAHGLRSLYECEPILLAWEGLTIVNSSDAAGFMSNLQSSVAATAASAHNVLACFARLASTHPTIVLARSAGSMLLHAALRGQNPDHIKAIVRLVLSAPLIKQRDFNNKHSFGGLGDKVYVTRNQRDQVLNLADFMDGWGKIVGFDDLGPGELGQATVLDFTQSERVHRLHDYLWLQLNEHQVQVHQALLSQTFDPEVLAKKHFHESSPLGGQSVLHVK